MANFLRKQFLITCIFLVVSLIIARVAMVPNGMFFGLLVAFELGYMAIILLVFILIMRANINKNIQTQMPRTDFDFNETNTEQFAVVYRLEQRKAISYSDIKKIARYHYVLFLYTVGNDALLIDINGFTVGTIRPLKHL